MSSAKSGRVKSKKSSKIIELRPLKLPRHQLHVLSNGLRVHLIARGPLPLVAVRLSFDTGSVFDPPALLGVGDFASRLMRRGAEGLGADEISDRVEFVGAAVGGSSSEENTIISLSTPTGHVDEMFEVFARIVRQPTFPEAEVELARRRALAQLANDLDDPGALADRALSRAIWGTHPYAHEAIIGAAQFNAYSRADLVEFHRRRLGPKIAQLYVAGQFEPDEMIELIERHFGDWSQGPEAVEQVPEWLGLSRPGEVLIVDKPEQTQAQVRIASKGVKRGHADHFPLMVMNTVLGGGFTSRLVREVRVERGLTYGIGSSFDMLRTAGSFSVASFTKTESINELIDVATTEVAKMKAKGATPQELATVQRYISGLYPARLETNEAIASAIADVVHYGLGDEWIAQYRERIAAVTKAQVADAARQHLHDERSIVLVGNAAQLTPRVSKYGAVRVISPRDLE